MRYIISIIFLSFCSLNSMSQDLSLSGTQDRFFVQVMLEESDESILSEIETGLQSNPYVFMVRLDRITNGLFVVTKDIQTINRSIFNSWMGGNDSQIDCYREGIHGVHEVLPFNANFCGLIQE